jgi:hypothetical protein
MKNPKRTIDGAEWAAIKSVVLSNAIRAEMHRLVDELDVLKPKPENTETAIQILALLEQHP